MSLQELAIFSPLPPTRSGIADYCQEQIQFLSRNWKLSIIIADDATDPNPVHPDTNIFRLTEWLADRRRDIATPRLYHLGNNPHHEFVYNQIHQRPGITVLHDYCLHHLIAYLTLGRGNFDQYKRLMEHDHGKSGAQMAHHRLDYIFSEYQQFLLPLNGTVLENSKGIIVHSEYARQSILDRYPEMNVALIPHHFAAPEPELLCGSQKVARTKLGIPTDKLIIVSLGFITPPKQIDLSLKALSQIKDKLPPFEYWLVGEPADTAILKKAIQENNLESIVKITGFVKSDDFFHYIEACDVIINLRYPSAGESSGTLVRALGMGKCAIVFDFQAFSDYPDDVVVKLPLDSHNADALANALEKVLLDTSYRSSFEKAAKKYINRHHDQRRCSDQYSEFISKIYYGSSNKEGAVYMKPIVASQLFESTDNFDLKATTSMVEKYINWIEDDSSREYALTHQRRWAKTLTYLPRPQPGMSALELGSYQVILPILRHEFGFDYVAGTGYDPTGDSDFRKSQLPAHDSKEDYDLFLFNLEADPYPFDNNSFDLVMCCEVIEHMSVDPMFMISEINRILKDNGVLVLTTPNIACARSINALLNGYAPYLYAAYNRNRSTDRHNIEYSPHEINVILEAGGFSAIRLETAACWEDTPDEIMGLLRRNGYPLELRDDNIIAVAKKQTPYINRYPEQIYGPGKDIRLPSSVGPFVD